ncbi:Hypothetical predicted protein [Octopus vulgaris]|uniref:Uncharacterized protein n=1 Tax=Octopus vulgaris TaxID=6645 RepID=A0AA36BN57_OCTVU|nr:Hypothetical predicted protein [Octopus vulgaris]
MNNYSVISVKASISDNKFVFEFIWNIKPTESDISARSSKILMHWSVWRLKEVWGEIDKDSNHCIVNNLPY